MFATAVRFLRVDLDLEVLEKDPASGYIVFAYADDGKTYRASLEVVATTRADVPRVNIIIDISDRPDYLETMMLERLKQKLRADLGAEPRQPKPAPAPPAQPPTPAPPGTPG